MSTDFWRQLEIFNPDEYGSVPIHLIGVGGIGSPTALALAKMGMSNITIYDDDTIENHNLPNQLYKSKEVGNAKANALVSSLEEYAVGSFKPVIGRVDSTTHLEGIVISGVDSMESRQQIWNGIKYKSRVLLYIDARMGAEVARIFAINPTSPVDVEEYESNLYPDSETAEESCTAKAIIYNTFMIASLIARQVRYYLTKNQVPRETICDLESLQLYTM